jgi:hypothetical protein
MSARKAPPDTVYINLMTRARLREAKGPKGIDRLLQTFERAGGLAPTHWGPDERTRRAWDRKQALALVDVRDKDGGNLHVWRTSAPKYEAFFNTANEGPKTLRLVFETDVRSEQLPGIFEFADGLAGTLETFFGLVQLLWWTGKQHDHQGATITPGQLQKFGLRSLSTRTFLCAELVKRLGRPKLAQCGAVEELAWGGARLDLVSPPWEADAAGELRARARALDLLAPSGLFGDYRRVKFEKPGAKWTPLAL